MLNLLTNPLATIATLYSFAEERLKREERGATAVEYGLMVALIAVVCVAAVGLLGGAANTTFTTATGSL